MMEIGGHDVFKPDAKSRARCGHGEPSTQRAGPNNGYSRQGEALLGFQGLEHIIRAGLGVHQMLGDPCTLFI